MYNIMCPADKMYQFFLSKECIPTYSAPAWFTGGKPSMRVTKQNKNLREKLEP